MAPVELDLQLIPARPAQVIGDRHWYHELLTGVSEGARSSSAAQLAGRYAHLGLATEEANMLMGAWNELNDPPLPHNELRATVVSVYRKHYESLYEVVDRLVAGG